jgi:hypothetical protein
MLRRVLWGSHVCSFWRAGCKPSDAGQQNTRITRRCDVDTVGLSLIGTFVLMMIMPVFALSSQKPPKREKKHAKVLSTVIG